MDDKGLALALLAQTVAPRLFKLFGTAPEDMGLPIYDTQEEVNVHVMRQFDPVSYWTTDARQIAIAVLNILEAGGASFSSLDLDAMCKAALLERSDVQP